MAFFYRHGGTQKINLCRTILIIGRAGRKLSNLFHLLVLLLYCYLVGRYIHRPDSSPSPLKFKVFQMDLSKDLSLAGLAKPHIWACLLNKLNLDLSQLGPTSIQLGSKRCLSSFILSLKTSMHLTLKVSLSTHPSHCFAK